MSRQILPMTREQTLDGAMAWASGALQNSDPRAVFEALLINASQVGQMIIGAERFTHAQVAALFGRELANALAPLAEAAAPSSALVVPR